MHMLKKIQTLWFEKFLRIKIDQNVEACKDSTFQVGCWCWHPGPKWTLEVMGQHPQVT